MHFKIRWFIILEIYSREIGKKFVKISSTSIWNHKQELKRKNLKCISKFVKKRYLPEIKPSKSAPKKVFWKITFPFYLIVVSHISRDGNRSIWCWSIRIRIRLNFGSKNLIQIQSDGLEGTFKSSSTRSRVESDLIWSELISFAYNNFVLFFLLELILFVYGCDNMNVPITSMEYLSI